MRPASVLTHLCVWGPDINYVVVSAQWGPSEGPGTCSMGHIPSPLCKVSTVAQGHPEGQLKPMVPGVLLDSQADSNSQQLHRTLLRTRLPSAPKCHTLTLPRTRLP